MKPLKFTFRTDGATLTGLSSSVSSATPLLVFANAVGMSLDLAARLAADMNARGLNFATWENRGSPGPARDDKDSTLEVQAHDLSCLIDSFPNESIVLLGWCTGASIALRYAATDPDRLCRLAFYSPAFLMSGSPGRPIGDDMFSMCGQICEDPPSAEVFYPIVRPKGGEERALGLKDHPDLLPEVLRPYAGGVKTLQRYAFAIRNTSAYNPRPLLQKINCPVLLLSADDDRLVSTKNCTHASAFLRECDIRMLRGMDHYSLFTNHSVIDAIADFAKASCSLRNRIPVSSDVI